MTDSNPTRNFPKARPLVPWPGGKRTMLKHIVPLVPVDHLCFVEVFGGAGSLLLSMMPRPGVIEVYNDIHGDLVNMYRMAKFHAPELARELAWTPNSRQEFYRLRDSEPVTEIQRAAKFITIARLCFGGMGESFGTSACGGGAAFSSNDGKMADVLAVGARLQKVCIECKDWREIIAIYDRPHTFFYFDPPYLGADTKRYKGWGIAELQELADRLRTIKGKWIVSMNDMPETRRVFSGWAQHYFLRAQRIENRGKAKTHDYAEMVVTSHAGKEAE